LIEISIIEFLKYLLFLTKDKDNRNELEKHEYEDEYSKPKTLYKLYKNSYIQIYNTNDGKSHQNHELVIDFTKSDRCPKYRKHIYRYKKPKRKPTKEEIEANRRDRMAFWQSIIRPFIPIREST
jgi:hypothetical protein